MKALYSLRPKASSVTSAPEILRIIKPATVVRAVSIAHHNCKLDHDQLAQLGANWLDGTVLMLPSITLVGDFLGVGYAAITEARGKRGNRPDPSMWLGLMARCWLNTSPEEHAIFAAAYEASLWHALECTTDVQRED
jgi:hypothetical protein